ncbi:MAG: hypothetical protein EP311_08530 [Cytophagales bacterium]|uniref:YD repeat-containing protein n=1 Tax=Algoriphagus taiwanensis TaxID=1445656 RepID=A0ABQ6Q4X0_9BACT|nr:MAG: hypothetical protein EP311_08530 [Cytophagales bacterium]GMQ35222.1 hypothetical protein Ataiwa_34950 [Algoriphagus taiwanensis]
MKDLLKFSFGLVFMWAGCTNSDDLSPDLEIDEHLILLEQVINGPLFQPAGKLKSELYFYGPQTLQYRRDLYYDVNKREKLSFTIKDSDTVRIVLTEYLEDDRIDQKRVFDRSSAGLFFAFFFKWEYSEENKIHEVLHGKDDVFIPYERFTYNDSGQITSYRRGTESNHNRHEYLYSSDLPNQIEREVYYESGSDFPLRFYDYKYNEQGLLAEKLLNMGLANAGSPEFVYIYNDKNQKIEEVVNDVRFGISPVERRVFEYY